MRRVVLEHTQGPHKGLTQILGNAEELTMGNRPLPEFLPAMSVLGRDVEFASLIRVTPRMVIYREVFPAPKGRFGQTMTSFHPEQR